MDVFGGGILALKEEEREGGFDTLRWTQSDDNGRNNQINKYKGGRIPCFTVIIVYKLLMNCYVSINSCMTRVSYIDCMCKILIQWSSLV